MSFEASPPRVGPIGEQAHPLECPCLLPEKAESIRKEDAVQNPKSDRDGSTNYYRFGAMILTSGVAMFILMYLNSYELSH